MKWIGLLLSVCLLAGCAPLLERTYATAEPHSSKFWESEAAGTLRAENHQDVVNDLLLLIGQHRETATLRLYNFESDLTVADPLHRATATHPVEIDPDSFLAYLLDTDTLSVNSLHHQAADEIGEGLWIPADSPEGFAEALELEDYPFCLAVQWHPEYMAGRTPSQQRLFQALVDACR